MRWLIGLLCLVCCVACDDATSESDQAADALKRQMEMMGKGQWQRLYDELHPAQQAIIPFDLFDRCYRQVFGGTTDIAVTEIVEVFDEPYEIDGTNETVSSKAVTATYAVTRAGRTETATATFHEVKVGDGWRWTIADTAPYREGRCSV